MAERLLTEELATTLATVGDLAERYAAARTAAAAQQRLAYLHAQLQELEAALGMLHQLAASTPGGTAVWHQTCAELRERAPAALRSPAAALVEGGLDLLDLVAYTGAFVRLVQERCATLQGGAVV